MPPGKPQMDPRRPTRVGASGKRANRPASCRPARGPRSAVFSGARAGLSVVELVVVMVLAAIMMSIAMPRLNIRRLKLDTAARSVTMIMMGAQRAAIQQQHNVVVSFDTVQRMLRVHYDKNNNNTIDAGERIMQYEVGEGVKFGRAGATARSTGSAAVTFTHLEGAFPAVTFSRAGTASEIGGFYLSSTSAGVGGVPSDARSLEVERATGRTERYLWNPQTSTWIREF